MVLESIKRTPLKVNPNVRLTDKSNFCNFNDVVTCFVVKTNVQHEGETSGDYPIFILF